MIRLYGPSVGFSSFAVVTKGFKHALEWHDSLCGFMPTDAFNEYETYGGALAYAGVLCGHPDGLQWLYRRGMHKYKAYMVAPNSNWVPPSIMMTACAVCTEILTPSKWGKEMLEKNFPENSKHLPIFVAPHGLLPGFESNGEPQGGMFSVLHLASTGLQRKSTLPLVDAFLDWDRADTRLTLVLTEIDANIVREHIARNGVGMKCGIDVVLRLNSSPSELSKVYSKYNVVCQPSRSEGFGMVPLEARACGVPVVATLCAGHSEHMNVGTDGVVRVETGPDAYINDGPTWAGPVAPTVDKDAIREALDYAYTNYADLKRAAMLERVTVSAKWAWENTLEPWISHVREMQKCV